MWKAPDNVHPLLDLPVHPWAPRRQCETELESKHGGVIAGSEARKLGVSDAELDALACIERKNPRRRSGPPARYYLRRAIEGIIGSRSPNEKAQRARRVEAAQRGGATRIRANEAHMFGLIEAWRTAGRLTPARVPIAELEKRAKAHLASRDTSRLLQASDLENAARHELTDYDALREALRLIRTSKSIARMNAYAHLAEVVAEEVRKIYPELSGYEESV